MSVLAYIVVTATLAGVLSVACAALFAWTARARWVPVLISYATGALLGAVFLEILPHALEAGGGARLGVVMLASILVFFVLEKAVLWRHSHHHGEDHPHSHGSGEENASAALIILGDTVHNFIDGIIIAAAFLSDVKLGIVTAIAIVAHEIPQEVGDFVVLLHAGYSKARAFAVNIVSSFATLAGGVLAYFALQHVQDWVAPLLGVAAASLLYVAVADLIPGLHKRLRARDALQQIGLLGLGVATVWLVGVLVHH